MNTLDDGLVRFSTEKYSLNTKNRYVHLTNYSINKKSKKFESNQDAGAATGHKWSMKILWNELRKAGHDTDAIWKNIKGTSLFDFVSLLRHYSLFNLYYVINHFLVFMTS